MVNQFKNNKFEKLFYDVDKEIALADYKTVYYLPRLESMLEYAFTNRNTDNEETIKDIQENLLVLRNEIEIQLEEFGEEKFQFLNSLAAWKLDSTTFKSTQEFFSTMKRIYINRRGKAQKAREMQIKELTSSPKKVEAYNKLKRDNSNEQVTSLVFDNKEKTRVLEYNGRLVQQIYPIFADPEPVNYFDFRTLFYLPIKYFAGRYYETLYFNAVFIWLMTLVLVLTLYYDVLKKIITMEGRFKSKSN